MIVAQSGFVGTIIFVAIIVVITLAISKSYEIDRRLYMAGLGAMMYLLISSTTESAFVNPLAIPLAIIIGLIFIKLDVNQKEIN